MTYLQKYGNRYSVKAELATLDATPAPDLVERSREMLPELPPYIEAAIAKLTDDKDFRGKLLTSEQKATFCRAYADTGSIMQAAERIHISPTTAYAHLRLDPDFQDAFALSKLSMLDTIQATSVRVAKMEKGTIDRMCQLRRLAPQVYRENQSQVNVGVALNLNASIAPSSPSPA